MFKTLYNIWEIGSKINISIKKSFLENLNLEIKRQFKTKKGLYEILGSQIKIPLSTFKSRLKLSYSCFIDLELILLICDKLNISRFELQKNILAYKTARGKNYIKNPILPIKITPIYDMLIAHNIGDGNLVKSKENRQLYFGYRQFNKEYKLLYLKKIESVFGEVAYSDKYYLKDNNTRIYFPIAVSDLMFKIYELNEKSFRSDTAIVPEDLFLKSHENLLCFLIAIIIDEGHIDSSNIIIRMKNDEFVKGLKRICDILDYKTTFSKSKDKMDNLYILSKDLKKFYNAYNKLLLKYPQINLGVKGKLIENILKRQSKPKLYLKGNKDKILQLLEKNNLSINNISEELNLSRQGGRYLINQLLKENKIKKVGIIKFGNVLYGKVN